MTKSITLLTITLLLAACSPQSGQDFTNAFSGLPTSKDIEGHKQKCAEMGFEAGSDAYGNCMIKLYDAHVSARSTLRNKATPAPVMGANRPVNCMGNSNGPGYYHVMCQ